MRIIDENDLVLGAHLHQSPDLVVDAASGPELTIGGTDFVLTADYARSGPDLALTGADGEYVLIKDFFAVETAPDLLTPWGARITGDLATKLAGPETPGQYAQAAGGNAAEPVGEVEIVDGTASVTRADGTQEALDFGTPIFQGDILQTGADGVVGIIFIDGMTMSLDEQTRVVVDEMFYDPGANDGGALFSVVNGALVFVSGEMAKIGPDAMQVDTPTGTIGIRGTHAGIGYKVVLDETSVVLFENPGGGVGAIAFTTRGGVTILDQINQITTANNPNAPPTAPVIVPLSQAQSFFGRAFSVNQDTLEQRGELNQQKAGLGAIDGDVGEFFDALDAADSSAEQVALIESVSPAFIAALTEAQKLILVKVLQPGVLAALSSETQIALTDTIDSLDEETLIELAEETSIQPDPSDTQEVPPFIPVTQESYFAALSLKITPTAAKGPILTQQVVSLLEPSSQTLIADPTVTEVTIVTKVTEEAISNILLGTDGPDTIAGSAGTQFIFGLGSDDQLFGLGGNDTIFGESGNDTLFGGDGNDILDGGTGNDSVFGGAGNDLLIGGSGEGNDLLDGGAGNDVISYKSTSLGIQVDLLEGVAFGIETDSDVISNVEVIQGGSGADDLRGSNGNDVLIGRTGADNLEGRGGNDLLVGGGGGNDAVYYLGDVRDYTIIRLDAGTVISSTLLASFPTLLQEARADSSFSFLIIDNNLSDGDDGTDTVTGVELAIFANAEINLGLNNAPIVQNASFSVIEGEAAGTTVGAVLAFDPDGDSISYQIDTGDTGGLFQIDTSGLITTTAPLNFDDQSSYTLSVLVTDQNGLSTISQVDVAVIDVPSNPPVANPDAFASGEDAVLQGNVFADNGAGVDFDPDIGDTFNVSAVNGSAAGVSTQITLTSGALLTLNADGTFIYDQNGAFNDLAANQETTDSFNYTIADFGGLTSTTTVTITIAGSNDGPIATANTNTIAEDGTFVSGNMITDDDGFGIDSDPDASDILSFGILDSTGADQFGALRLDSVPGSYTYAIDNTNPAVQALAVGETLTEVYTYTISDGNGGTDSATLMITVTGTNDGPTATANTNAIAEDGTSVSGNMITDNDGNGTDSDPDATDILTVSNLDTAEGDFYGTLTLDNADGSYTYALDNTNPEVQALGVGETLSEFYLYAISDGNGGTDTATLIIAINGTNDGPVARADTLAVDEDATLSGDVFADNGAGMDFDPDASDTFSVTAVNGNTADVGNQIGLSSGALLTLNANGTYAYVQNGVFDSLPFGTTATDSFTYTITDGNGATSTATATITINGVNDAPVASDASFAVDEQLAAGAFVGTVAAIDVDAGDTFTFAITAGDPGGDFSIDPLTGEITTNRTFTTGEDGPFTLTVTATDGGGAAGTATVSVLVGDVNQAPVAQDATFNFAENQIAGSVVGTVIATDADSIDTLTYAITAGDPAGNFAIDAATGEITSTRAFDFEAEGPFNLTVTVTDNGVGSLTDTATVAVAVTDVNDAPVALDASFSVAENLAAGAIVGTVSASDQDTADILSYAITAGDAAGNFLIDAATGEITTTRAFDFETEGPFSLTVTVTDDGTGTLMDTATVAVAVTDANDAPVALDASLSIAENLAAGAVVGTVSASDQDTADTLSYAITAGDAAGNFLIDAATGEITTTRAFDFETEGPFSLTVTVTDDGTGTLMDTATVAVAVTDANDAPVALDASFSVAENLAAGAIVGTVSASDQDTADTLSYAITAGDAAGNFLIDAATGEITTTRAFDFETEGPFSLTVTVTDDGTGTLMDTATVAVAVTDANDAPVALDASLSIAENQAAGAVVGTVSASDQDTADTLSYAITAGDAADNFLIDAATGEITTTRAFDFETEGPFSLTVTVTDDGTGTLMDTATVAVAVTDANDAPVALDASFSVAENLAAGAIVGTVSASDQDTADTLSYAITAGDAAGNFLIDAATGEITTTRAFDFETEGPFSLTVTVTDDGTGTLMDTATVAVAVTDANDAPVALDASFSVAENLAAGAIVGTVSASDQDTADTLSYAITAGDAADNFLIDAATGEITTTRAFDFETEGPFSLTVTVTDDGTGTLMDTATVAVAVTDANDAPVALDASFSVAENLAAGAIVGTVSASDQDTADTLSYAITAGDAAGNFLIDAATGEITTTRAFDFETEGPFSLTVTVTDDGTGTLMDTATVAVAVTDANDAPVAADDFLGLPDLDIFLVRDGESDRVLINDGSGIFSDSGQALSTADGRGIDLGDLDGDGDLDAFVTNSVFGGAPDEVYLNDGAGVFTSSGQSIGNVRSRGVALGDLDGDGDLDAFTVAGNADPNLVYLNDGSGAFTVTGQILGTGSSYSVQLTDVEGDGDLDAIVTDRQFGAANLLYLNDGTGTFTDSTQVLGTGSTFEVALGDLDGDGDDDAVIANAALENNQVFLNNAGTFTDTGQALGGRTTVSVALGDLDGDGDLDAFFGNTSNDQVFFNDGAGNFTDSGQFLASFETDSVELADVDRDGDLDAIISNGTTGNLLLYLNDGAGNFSDSGQILGTGTNLAVEIGDLDGDSVVILANTTSTLDVLANDTDQDTGDVLTITAVGASALGAAVTIGSGGLTLDYDPTGVAAAASLGNGETLVDTFTYTISDGNGGTDTATVTVTVTGVNGAPVAVDDAFNVSEDAILSGDVFADNGSGADSDPEGDAFSVTAVNGTTTDVGTQVTLTSGALLTLNADGTFSYDQNGVFNALAVGVTTTDSFTYTIRDSLGLGSTAPVIITINGVNDAPVVVPDAFAVDEDAALSGNVFDDNGSGADSDPEGDAFSVTAVNGTTTDVGTQVTLTSGALLTLNADGTFSYDQNGVFNALAVGVTTTDSFTYTIRDSLGLGSTAPVIITINGVNDAPVVVPDAFAVDEDAALSGNVFDDNGSGADSDPEGDAFSVTAVNGTTTDVGTQVTLTSGALLTLNADGTFSYDQNGVFNALAVGVTTTDSFTYTIRDSLGLGSTAPVIITINGVNDAPVVVPDAFAVDEDAALSGNVFDDNGSGADSDPEGDAFSVTAVNGTTTDVGTQVTLTSGALLTVNADGTFSYDQNGVFNALAVGVTTTDSFTYTIRDSLGLGSTAPVIITINGVNDAPVVVPDAFAVDEDAALSGNVFDDNGSGADSDPEGDAFSVTAVNGTTTDVGTQVTLTSGALLTLNADGTFSYDQNGVFNALAVGVTTTDSFTYTIRDSLGLGSTAPVIITINGVNDAPVVVPDAFAVDEDAALSGNVFDDNGSGADSDPEGDAFSVTAVNGTTTDVGTQVTLTSGALLTVNADGTFSYDQNGVFNALAVGVTTTDSFTYTIRDSLGLGSTAPVIITITGVNDDPFAADDIFGFADLDVFIANVGTSPDVVLLNDGSGTLVDTAQTLGTSNGAGVAVGDLDGDGDLDAFVVNILAQADQVYFNDGTGSFTPSGQAFSVLSSSDVELGDLDGDGDLDAFVTSSTLTNADKVYLNDGSGIFTDTGQTLGLGQSYDVELADVDGDGDLDAIVADYDFTGVNKVYLNDGTGTFTDSLENLGTGPTFDIAAGDVDGDGDIDVVVARHGDISSRVYLNDGNGAFTDSEQSGLYIQYAAAVALGDLDGDGDLDAYFGDSTYGDRVFLNNGAGVFTDSLQSIGGAFATNNVEFLDVDQDGDLDAILSGDQTRLFLNDGASVFTDSGQILSTFGSQSAAVGDLDGDSTLILANTTSTLDPLANDTDPDVADTLIITAVGASALGAVVTIDAGSLTLTYDPTGVAAAAQLGDGETLVDTFTYSVSDGRGGTDTATATITITGVNAAPIATDDFLGLPDLDVFVANASGRSEQVYLNDGLGNFTDTGQTIGASSSTDSAVGDLDGDGDVDVIVANSGGQANLVYFNDGSGNLTDSGALLGAVNSVSVALGDVDLDGDLDAIFGNATGLARADKVYLNDGSGGFTDSGQTLGNASTSDLVFADVDSDGDLDILAGHRDAAVANVLYLNDGSGVFSDSGQSLGTATTVTIATGDFDGDGDIDFLAGNYAGGDTVWLNDGTGIFTDSGQSIGTSNSSQITLADLDGDGDLDAFAASGNFQADRVYFNDGNGVFTDSGQALDAFFSTGVELGDIDRDGDLDAIVSTSSLEEIIYLNDGSGGFTNDGVGLSGSNGSVDLKLADLDGDSNLILANTITGLDVLANDADGDAGDTLTIVGIGTSALGAVVTIGSGGLTLDYDPTGVATAQQLGDGETLVDTVTYNISDGRGGTATATATITITGVNAAPVAADDVLGFADLDAYVPGGFGAPDRYFENDGTGVFTDSGQLLGTAESTSVAEGDLDGDGDLDVFVTSTPYAANLVYFNDGTGTFTDSGQALGASPSMDVELGDLDGDGDLDAFVGNRQFVADQVYLNDGSGIFTDSGQLLGSSRTYGVELADVDGDGDLDAFTSDFTTGGANKLYLNDGSGNFTDSGQSLGTGPSFRVISGDIDGDGDNDLVVANENNTGNQVFLNDGSGIFSDTGQSLGSSATRGIQLGDLDGDGDLDIFAANRNGTADRVYFNDGSGVFTDSGQALGTLESFGVKLADVDQDGDLDAFIATGSNANRIFLNDGSGIFTDSGQSVGFSNTSDVALADFDGDSNLILANTTTTLDVLANDTDTDAGDLLTIIGVGTSALGAIITIDAGGLTLNYDPTGVTAAQQLANDETLTDSFTYTVDDGRGGLSTATVSLSLTGNEPVVIDLTGLSATDGFIVQGDLAGDRAGFSVSDAGDVNGDGFDDVIVGATGGSDGGAAAGEAYVIFGKASGFGTVDLTGLLASDGFIIQGDVALDEAGYSVASAGDVNGDGFDDLIVGARGADGGGTDAGAAYVIFGRATGPALIDLTGLTAIDGFRIQGDEANDYSGRSVSSAGDINGDGFDDVIIGAHRGDDGGNAAGEAYVIFGKNTGFSDIDLTTLTTADGFIIQGDAAADQAGRSVSSAGDVNGDGFDDLIVGAIYGAGGGLRAGEAYVIFGKDTGFDAVLDLGLISPTDGFIIQGDMAEDRLGRSVSGAGDVNGDGYDDLIVSAPYGDNGGISAGEAYVIFGKASLTGTVDLTDLAATDGFIIQGDEARDYAGFSVSGAGDVNGDGFDDVIVGAMFGDDGGSYAGEAYVIFGKASGFGRIDLSGLAPTDGFIIQGDEADDQLGRSVSGAGDVDGDGFDDLIVGAAYGDDGGYNAGEAYVIFGGNFTGAVTLLGTAGADILIGTAGDDNIIGAQGDDTITGGAGDDRMAGAFGDDTFVLADGSGNDVISGFSTGARDIIDLSAFGFADFAALSAAMTESLGDVTIQLDADDSLVLEDVAIADLVAADFAIGNEPLVIDLTGLALADGFIIQGDEAGDRAGRSVSDAGDVNGDGFADVIVGAPFGDDGGAFAGEAYVVFGKASGFGTVDLTGLSAADGFIIQGDVALDQAGYSVGSAGDVNGDGFDDLIVGASGAAGGGTDAGAAYVIFGRATGPALIDLTGLTAIDGFRIQGDEAYDYSGRSVSGAGDINGDGFDDVIIGAHRGDDGGTNAGEAYVIFGKATGFTDIDLTTLNIADGFIIQGDAGADQAGRSVSSAGDVNGDGFDDLIVGAIYGAGGGLRAGEAYVIFGKNTGFGTVDLGLLTPADGFIIQGDTDEDRAGWSVSGAGDVNGDGYDDVIIGTPFGDDGGGGAGEAYVVFGKTSGFGTIDLTGLAPADGFIIQGDEAGDLAGWSVSGAGDVNGDGFDDVIVGARWGDDGGDRTGEAYVVFGKASGFGTIDLSALVPADGFIIQGDAADDRLGRSVSGAGDVDGDGFDDLIVGAYYGDDSGTDAGEAYVIFGGNFTSAVTLLGTAGADILIGTTGNDNIIGAQGDDTITGGAGDDRMAGAFGDDTFVLADGSGNDVISGFSTGAGDIIDLSAFGFADFAALSAAMTESLGDVTIQLDIDDSLVLEDVAIADLVAADFVIGNEPSVVIDMTGLSATDGFVIQGDEAGDQAGFSVSDAGDVNGDGFDDVIVGALGGDDGGNFAGEAYVVFGKASGFGPIDLTGLSATDGFIIQGDLPVDLAGYSVGSAGDVNGDGFDDVIVGARSADGGGSYAGAAYVIFGKAAGIGTIDLTGLSLVDGFSIQGDEADDRLGRSVSGAGDVNGDGFGDLIVGAYFGDDGGANAGEAYVIFGKASGFGNIDLTGLTAADGFIIQGDVAGDWTGFSVSSAGDVNGDGFDDVVAGAPRGDDGGASAGEAYVIFGRATGPVLVDLTGLTATDGFIIQGDVTGDQAGFSVSGAGDVNGDGYDDLIVGTPFGDDGGNAAGEAYVIFGKASAFGTVDLTGLSAAEGFIIQGDVGVDRVGFSVSGAGDVNGDGFDDLIVGTPYGADGGIYAGEAYVIFGKASVFGLIDLSDLAPTDGFIIQGDVADDRLGQSVSGAGDIDGDGFDDLIVGAKFGDDGGTDAGEAYVIFGGNFTGAVTLLGTAGADVLTGTAGGDVIFAGLGDDTIDGAGGIDRLSGGAGDDDFVVQDTGSLVTIIDFEGGVGLGDRLELSAFGFADFAAVQAAASASGPGGHDTLIQLDADDSVLLEDFEVADLNIDDVVIA